MLHDALVGNPQPRKIKIHKIHKIHTVKFISEISYPLEPPSPTNNLANIFIPLKNVVDPLMCVVGLGIWKWLLTSPTGPDSELWQFNILDVRSETRIQILRSHSHFPCQCDKWTILHSYGLIVELNKYDRLTFKLVDSPMGEGMSWDQVFWNRASH